MSRKQIKITKHVARIFLLALILISSFSFVAFGQTEDSDETPVVIPDQMMEQVVRRILIWNFKPRNKPTTIYLAEKGIQKSWLPEIKGIKFQLLSEAEIAEKEGVHFFTKLKKLANNKFDVGFAFGDPTCSYMGDSWNFRISKEKIKLWKSGGGFGGGCSHGSLRGNG